MRTIYYLLGFVTTILVTACGGGGDTPGGGGGGGSVKPSTDYIIINDKSNLSELTIEANSTEAVLTVSVPENKTWKMTINRPNWPDFDATPLDGSNGARVTITTNENPESSNREASLVFTCGNLSKTLKVIQKAGSGLLSIKDNIKSLSFNVDGESKTISIDSNVKWKATVLNNSTWVKLDKSSGDGDAELTITAEPNTDTEDRSTTLRISSEQVSTTYDINITQPGKTYNLSIKPDVKELALNEDGDSKTISISGNVKWKAAILNNSTWAKLDKSSGEGDGEVTVTAEANTETEARSTTLKISCEQISTTFDINLTQPGKAYNVSVSPDAINFGAAGGEKSAIIASNASWKATTGETWISVTPSGGAKSDKDITISVSPYYSMELGRSGSVTLTSGDKTAQIAVTQNAAKQPTIQGLKAEKVIGKNQYTIKFTYTSEFAPTEYGIYMGTSSNPTGKTVLSTSGSAGSNVEVSTVIDVEQAVRYYVKAYIVSPVTTAESSEFSFMTEGDIPTSSDISSPDFKGTRKK